MSLYLAIYLHKHRRIALAVATLSAICTWPLAADRPTARTAAYRLRRGGTPTIQPRRQRRRQTQILQWGTRTEQ
jgi:hypothetical protein